MSSLSIQVVSQTRMERSSRGNVAWFHRRADATGLDYFDLIHLVRETWPVTLGFCGNTPTLPPRDCLVRFSSTKPATKQRPHGSTFGSRGTCDLELHDLSVAGRALDSRIPLLLRHLERVPAQRTCDHRQLCGHRRVHWYMRRICRRLLRPGRFLLLCCEPLARPSLFATGTQHRQAHEWTAKYQHEHHPHNRWHWKTRKTTRKVTGVRIVTAVRAKVRGACKMSR